MPVACVEWRVGDELAVGPIRKGDGAERLDRGKVVAEGGRPLLAPEPANDIRHRPARQPALDDVLSGFAECLDARRVEGQPAIDRGQHLLLLPQFAGGEAPSPRQSEDAVGAERVDQGLAALADKRGLAYAEAAEQWLPFRPGGAQFTVRRTSGRSREKAGMAMLKSSPWSFCIWYVPTMIPDVVGSGQPLV